MSKSRKIPLILFLIFVSGAMNALHAHPHVFITTEVGTVFDSTGICGFRVKYYFDPVYSQNLVQEFETDKNGTFEEAELKVLQEKAFSNLINYSYFLHVWAGGKKITHGDVSDFNAFIEYDELIYTFFIHTRIPVGPDEMKIKIAIYEHTYFLDVSLDEKKVTFENTSFYQLDYAVIKDKTLAYFYDQVYPPCIVLNVRKK